MQIVDADRLLWVQQQQNYRVSMASLEPLEITPKNNVILGIPCATATTSNREHEPRVAFVALAASALENADAEAGERQKTGLMDFGAAVVQ